MVADLIGGNDGVLVEVETYDSFCTHAVRCK
jgi:hypothetical protein